eukprot:6343175-Amphidinium_carterae.1
MIHSFLPLEETLHEPAEQANPVSSRSEGPCVSANPNSICADLSGSEQLRQYSAAAWSGHKTGAQPTAKEQTLRLATPADEQQRADTIAASRADQDLACSSVGLSVP